MGSLDRIYQRTQSALIKSQIRTTRHASSGTGAAQSTATASKTTNSSPVVNEKQSSQNKEQQTTAAKKTMAELDEELRLKLEGRSGEGGEAGLELEDGKPAAMKRGVKNNMFRLI
ncbi:hypothetical protein MMC07_008251 [Pseudocyphellaria aurata]|nr:hypothetical protein [Pseudocyphellaria aurata]